MVASQRRLERKLKELNMTLDEERQSHTDQKDQVFAAALSQVSTSERGEEGEGVSTPNRTSDPDHILQLTLRVKALKRQVDEGETELERIETQRRKALRDMEEQQELKDALQARVTALETELK